MFRVAEAENVLFSNLMMQVYSPMSDQVAEAICSVPCWSTVTLPVVAVTAESRRHHCTDAILSLAVQLRCTEVFRSTRWLSGRSRNTS